MHRLVPALLRCVRARDARGAGRRRPPRAAHEVPRTPMSHLYGPPAAKIRTVGRNRTNFRSATRIPYKSGAVLRIGTRSSTLTPPHFRIQYFFRTPYRIHQLSTTPSRDRHNPRDTIAISALLRIHSRNHHNAVGTFRTAARRRRLGCAPSIAAPSAL